MPPEPMDSRAGRSSRPEERETEDEVIEEGTTANHDFLPWIQKKKLKKLSLRSFRKPFWEEYFFAFLNLKVPCSTKVHGELVTYKMKVEGHSEMILGRTDQVRSAEKRWRCPLKWRELERQTKNSMNEEVQMPLIRSWSLKKYSSRDHDKVQHKLSDYFVPLLILIPGEAEIQAVAAELERLDRVMDVIEAKNSRIFQELKAVLDTCREERAQAGADNTTAAPMDVDGWGRKSCRFFFLYYPGSNCRFRKRCWFLLYWINFLNCALPKQGSNFFKDNHTSKTSLTWASLILFLDPAIFYLLKLFVGRLLENTAHPWFLHGLDKLLTCFMLLFIFFNC